MKRSGFKRKTYKEALRDIKSKKRVKKPKRDLMPNRLKRAKKEAELVSHTYVRKRDSISEDRIHGYCFDCGKYDEGQQFQAGHFEPSGSCGALLRYHPRNMHGQSGSCNCKYNQEKVKIGYTLKMIEKYGKEYVDFLRSLKKLNIKADIIFYEGLIHIYKVGTEQEICDYLENYPYFIATQV